MPPRPSNMSQKSTSEQTELSGTPTFTEAQSSMTMKPQSFGAKEGIHAPMARHSRVRRAHSLQPSMIATSELGSVSESHSSTESTISATAYTDPLPDLPAWLGYAMAGMLAFGFVAAITLWLVQFYPRHSRLRVKTKRGYHEVRNGEFEMQCYSTGTPNGQSAAVFSCRAGCGEVSTAAASPAKGSAVRKRKPKNLSIDTNIPSTGLGIAIPAQQNQHQPSPVRAKSERSSGASSPGHSPWIGAVRQHATSAPPSTLDLRPNLTKFEHTKKTFREFRSRRPGTNQRDKDTMPFLSRLSSSLDEDIMESGLVSPSSKPLDKPSKSSPTSSPNSSRSPSRVRVVLDRVEVGIEWATEMAVRIFHDQMVKEDREEGLLLPVRAEERT